MLWKDCRMVEIPLHRHPVSERTRPCRSACPPGGRTSTCSTLGCAGCARPSPACPSEMDSRICFRYRRNPYSRQENVWPTAIKSSTHSACGDRDGWLRRGARLVLVAMPMRMHEVAISQDGTQCPLDRGGREHQLQGRIHLQDFVARIARHREDLLTPITDMVVYLTFTCQVPSVPSATLAAPDFESLILLFSLTPNLYIYDTIQCILCERMSADRLVSFPKLAPHICIDDILVYPFAWLRLTIECDCPGSDGGTPKVPVESGRRRSTASLGIRQGSRWSSLG